MCVDETAKRIILLSLVVVHNFILHKLIKTTCCRVDVLFRRHNVEYNVLDVTSVLLFVELLLVLVVISFDIIFRNGHRAIVNARVRAINQADVRRCVAIAETHLPLDIRRDDSGRNQVIILALELSGVQLIFKSFPLNPSLLHLRVSRTLLLQVVDVHFNESLVKLSVALKSLIGIDTWVGNNDIPEFFSSHLNPELFVLTSHNSLAENFVIG